MEDRRNTDINHDALDFIMSSSSSVSSSRTTLALRLSCIIIKHNIIEDYGTTSPHRRGWIKPPEIGAGGMKCKRKNRQGTRDG